MKLIVGLGNPGKKYENTRHNVGFMVIDNLALTLGVKFEKGIGCSMLSQATINGEKVILLKPQKFINLSGEVIRNIIDYYKINIENILIISDDIDLNIGTFKLKAKGSPGGHNGLKDIEKNLNTNEYKRLKIGTFSDHESDARDFVLGKFSSDEKVVIDSIIEKSKEIIIDFISISYIELMNKYN